MTDCKIYIQRKWSMKIYKVICDTSHDTLIVFNNKKCQEGKKYNNGKWHQTSLCISEALQDWTLHFI